jgi:integrase
VATQLSAIRGFARWLSMTPCAAGGGRAILEVLGRTGLRRSELCARRWDDIVEVPRWPDPRLRDAVAERPAEETASTLRIEHSKRGRSCLVPLARPVVAALEPGRRPAPAPAPARTTGATGVHQRHARA